ncbi:MAG: hypothetical protein WBA31_07025 [Candidatus Dormiibacterota bacterium]
MEGWQLAVSIVSLGVLGFIGLQTFRIEGRAAEAARKAESRAELDRVSLRVQGVVESVAEMRAYFNEKARLGKVGGPIPVGSPENLERVRYQTALGSRLAAVGKFQVRLTHAVGLSEAAGTYWTSTDLAAAIDEANALLAELADADSLALAAKSD